VAVLLGEVEEVSGVIVRVAQQVACVGEFMADLFRSKTLSRHKFCPFRLNPKGQFTEPAHGAVLGEQVTSSMSLRPGGGECLCLEGRRSFKSEDMLDVLDVLDVLRELFVVRGVPGNIRSDNGPEFVAKATRKFLKKAEVQTLYIAPGSPWENGYAESLHSRVRDELLDAELFADLREACVLASRWKNDYNHRRPHSSLGYRTPAEYASSLRQGQLRATPSAGPAAADQPPTLITVGA